MPGLSRQDPLKYESLIRALRFFLLEDRHQREGVFASLIHARRRICLIAFGCTLPASVSAQSETLRACIYDYSQR